MRFLTVLFFCLPIMLTGQLLPGVGSYEVYPVADSLLTVRFISGAGIPREVSEYPAIDSVSAKNLLFNRVEELYNASAALQVKQVNIELELNQLTRITRALGYDIPDYQAAMTKILTPHYNGKWQYLEAGAGEAKTLECTGLVMQEGGANFASIVPKARNLILLTLAATGEQISFKSENGQLYIGTHKGGLLLLSRLK